MLEEVEQNATLYLIPDHGITTGLSLRENVSKVFDIESALYVTNFLHIKTKK